MNILSYNIRGGGSSTKRKRNRFFIQAGKVDLCFFQETKLGCIDSSLTFNIWGNKDVKWSFSGSNGAAGRGDFVEAKLIGFTF